MGGSASWRRSASRRSSTRGDPHGALRGGAGEARPDRPALVGQASRISGVRPPDIAVLLVHLRKGTAAERKDHEQEMPRAELLRDGLRELAVPDRRAGAIRPWSPTWTSWRGGTRGSAS